MTSKAPWTHRSIPGHLFEINSTDGPVLRIRGGMNPTLADTRLIAAAPEMLEALEAVYQYAKEGYGRSNSAEQRLAVIDKVWAAIQKARGQQ